MKFFYAIFESDAWVIKEDIPKCSYIVVQAKSLQDAKIKLHSMVNGYNLRIYL